MTKLITRILVYTLLLSVFSVFSYSFTDPNLVLSSNPWYWQFQQYMWQTFFINEALTSYVYIGLVSALLISWWFYARSIKEYEKFHSISSKLAYSLLIIPIIPLIFSYNALSHDVFNYMFNAKMVLVYGANPHVLTALSFPGDLWTRFMHNTHTVAPYGYGWTALSLIPSALGMQIFSITWMLFRIFSVTSLFITVVVLRKLMTLSQSNLTPNWYWLLVVFSHPLIILEVVLNIHNDLWMMAPALASFLILYLPKSKPKLQLILASVLLLFSISIKFATIVLVPIFAITYFLKFTNLLSRNLTGIKQMVFKIVQPFIQKAWSSWMPVFAVLATLPLLLFPRAQFFHPWYFLWLMVWIPLIRQKFIKIGFLIAASGILFRYVPWIAAGGFEEHTLLWQQLITLISVFILPFLLYKKSRQWL